MPTPDGQYRLDEFVGEVIGIAHLRRIHLDMPERNGDPVTLIVCFTDPETREWVPFTASVTARHRTMGRALADVRQQIKERWGR